MKQLPVQYIITAYRLNITTNYRILTIGLAFNICVTERRSGVIEYLEMCSI